MIKEYRYIKEYAKLKGTMLSLYNIYRIEPIGRYMYNVYEKNYDIKICTITSKMLNHFFEPVK